MASQELAGQAYSDQMNGLSPGPEQQYTAEYHTTAVHPDARFGLYHRSHLQSTSTSQGQFPYSPYHVDHGHQQPVYPQEIYAPAPTHENYHRAYQHQYMFVSSAGQESQYKSPGQWQELELQNVSHDSISATREDASTVGLSHSEPPGAQPGGQRRRRWWWRAQTGEGKALANWNAQFQGGKGWHAGHFFTRPTKDLDVEQGHVMVDRSEAYGVRQDNDGKFMYLNKFSQWEVKYSDVAVYLSPTNYRPKRLVVQATPEILRDKHAGGDWRRRKMTGDVPKILTLSEWGLRPLKKRGFWHKVDGTLRLLLISVPVQIMMTFPGTAAWDSEEIDDNYTDFPAYHWQWPKYAINPLDQKPTYLAQDIRKKQDPSSRRRSVRPRLLYVQRDDGAWEVMDTASKDLHYVFVSYAANLFKVNGVRNNALIREMAQEAAKRAGCRACWIDTDCMDPENGSQKDADIYAMCDVMRSSTRTIVILPDTSVEGKKHWGSRMWTLPEALLAEDKEIDFLAKVGENQYTMTTSSLLELTGEIWDDREDSEETGGSTRLLAEHYTGELTLSSIELFVVAVDAFFHRSDKDPAALFTDNDVPMGVMGLFHNRLEFDGDNDTAFQSFAKLSLGNDTNRILERMVSLYPSHSPMDPSVISNYPYFNPFYTLANTDQYGTHLWDVEPSCYVVGVAHEDNTLVLDSCRVMHIRWKGFTRIAVVRDKGLGRLLATFFVTAGTWWFIQGIYLAINYAPLLSAQQFADLHYSLEFVIAAFFFTAIFLSAFGPVSVSRLYGGQVLQSSSSLVGFEGVMPIDKLEELMFGCCSGRLSYAPGSSPVFAEYRDDTLRIGKEPKWVTDGIPHKYPPLPKGHRYFTLVDTGNLSVTIFTARRPPTVAVLSGREGGMLRAILCSWRFESDCLYKEAVVRMTSDTSDGANLKAWLKLCLLPMDLQDKVEKAGMRIREDRKNKQQKR